MAGRALILILAWCAVAAAAPLAVEPRAPAEALLAQRLEMGDALEFVALELGPSLTDQPARGTSDAPVEMREAPSPAGTVERAGQWTYAATVREREPGSVPTGRFVLELEVDGVSVGTVHLAQDAANAALKEGARVSFALPRSPTASALYALAVRALPVEVGEIVLRSAPGPSADGYVWLGTDNRVNPAFAGRVGIQMAFRIIDGDATGVPHNLVLLDGEGAVVKGPSSDVDEPEESATLTWTPPTMGAYHYACQYHPSMTGDLQVNP